MNKREAGGRFEAIAAEYLEKHGCRIICRNFRSRRAEADIVAVDGRYLVFVEVKQRSSSRRGSGLEAVNREKQRRICMAAEYYMRRFHIPPDMPVRFDVISVDHETVRHIKNAFPCMLSR